MTEMMVTVQLVAIGFSPQANFEGSQEEFEAKKKQLLGI